MKRMPDAIRELLVLVIALALMLGVFAIAFPTSIV
jgi:hypothetical protein